LIDWNLLIVSNRCVDLEKSPWRQASSDYFLSFKCWCLRYSKVRCIRDISISWIGSAFTVQYAHIELIVRFFSNHIFALLSFFFLVYLFNRFDNFKPWVPNFINFIEFNYIKFIKHTVEFFNIVITKFVFIRILFAVIKLMVFFRHSLRRTNLAIISDKNRLILLLSFVIRLHGLNKSFSYFEINRLPRFLRIMLQSHQFLVLKWLQVNCLFRLKGF
jgi:hypothetical protein